MTEAEPSEDCPFCAITAGRLPASIVAETPRLLAFLDSNPIRPGHLQIMPRAHFPHFNALPSALAAEMLDMGQRLAAAQRAAFKVDRVGFFFPAGELPHARVHVVPLLSPGDVTFRRLHAGKQVPFCEEPGLSGEELATAALCLRRSLSTAEGIGAMP